MVNSLELQETPNIIWSEAINEIQTLIHISTGYILVVVIGKGNKAIKYFLSSLQAKLPDNTYIYPFIYSSDNLNPFLDLAREPNRKFVRFVSGLNNLNDSDKKLALRLLNQNRSLLKTGEIKFIFWVEPENIAVLQRYAGDFVDWRNFYSELTDVPKLALVPNHNLPFKRNHNFIGRKQELSLLHNSLSPNKPTTLTGLGGIGKTQIALQYAHKYFNDYKHILWVNADGADITEKITRLAPFLGLKFSNNISIPERSKQVTNKLEQGGPHLLILDNVEKKTSFRHHLPKIGQTRVLITTRRSDIQGVKKLSIDVLPPDKALKLLCVDLSLDDAELEYSKTLCKKLGYHTLAISVANRILVESGFEQPSDILAEISEVGITKWSEEAPEDTLFSKEHQIAQLFDLSFNLLKEDNQVDDRAKLFLLLGCWFSPDGVSLELLSKSAEGLSEEVSGKANKKAASRLLSLGLATTDQERNLIFHRVVRDYSQKKGGDKYKNAVMELLTEIAKGTSTDTLELLKQEVSASHYSEVLKYLTGQNQRYLNILYILFQYLITTAQYESALEVAQIGNGLAEDKTWRATFCHSLGRVFDAQGKYSEALKYYFRALDIYEETQGKQHPETATTLNNIGESLRSQGKYSEALKYYLRALEIYEETLGKQHPSTATTLDNMGQVFYSQGGYSEALEYYLRALEIKEETLGKQHPSTATTLNNMGLAYYNQGDKDKALKYLQNCLKIWKKTLGDSHPNTLTAKNSIDFIKNNPVSTK